jgi:hemerythrin
MEKIIWHDGFSVGVAKLDSQHRKLVDMINNMIENPLAETRSETIGDILTEMTNYAIHHFKTEEELLSIHNYPRIDAQKQMHKEFRIKTVAFCFQTTAGIETVPENVFNFLRDWLVNHILEEDMKYSEFFNEKGVS